MTNSNQKERFRTRIVMQEQNITVLQNKCEEYLGELDRTRKALEIIKKEMSNEYMPDFAVISDALKTALEQKDVK